MHYMIKQITSVFVSEAGPLFSAGAVGEWASDSGAS